MIQGAGSNVGKSLVVAGLCRAFVRRGLSVRPFKPQNMSNNAAATSDGEIGRAQALQARAAKTPASVDMNPVLLKPESETGAQIIVQGRRWGTMRARAFGQRKQELLPRVLESYHRLAVDADLIVIEGAGSPAETNLRAGDIANMGFAEAADVPVILVGDIERGGVIASLVGTHTVLDDRDRDRIKAFIVNKFRGDVSLFDDGVTTIAARTGWRALGVLPYFDDAQVLPGEDMLDLVRPGANGGAQDVARSIKIVVPICGRIANFDDLDPLRLEPGVELALVEPGRPLPRDADLILLPGSKNTIQDLAALRAQGWDIDIAAHVRQGGAVLGLCGGYQILGRTIDDPNGIEGRAGKCAGLGLLDVATVLTPDKVVRPVRGRALASGSAVSGYEIHLGRTCGSDTVRAPFEIEGRRAGAASPDGRIIGVYVHGLFANDDFRRAFLSTLRAGDIAGGQVGWLNFENRVESAIDALAEHLERHIDLDHVLKIARAD